MKHFFIGILFYLFTLPSFCFATISIKLSDLTPKDDYFEVTAVVSGMSSSSATFIQGMFIKAGGSNYFGSTFSKKGEWLNYDGSPEKSFVVENFLELKNDTPQKIFVKPNYDDKNYTGPGKYLLKVKRYTASGSSSDYADNYLEVDLSHSTPTPEPTVTESHSEALPAGRQESPSTVTPTPTPKPTITTKTSPSVIANLVPELWQSSSSPQVIATSSSDPASSQSSVIPDLIRDPSPVSTPSSPILSDKNLFLLGASIFAISGGLLYFRLKTL